MQNPQSPAIWAIVLTQLILAAFFQVVGTILSGLVLAFYYPKPALAIALVALISCWGELRYLTKIFGIQASPFTATFDSRYIS